MPKLKVEKDTSDYPQKEPREKTWQKRPSSAKFPHAKDIMQLFPGYVLSWIQYKQFCVAAESLFAERGMDDVREAMKYYLKHQDESFIPSIFTPIDLDSKWDKLVAYSLKKK